MAVNDLLTLDEAHRAINLDVDVADHDDELAVFVSAVSEAADVICGPVVAREVIEYFDGYGLVVVTTTPVLSVTSVTESGVTVATTDWRLDGSGHDATLVRLSGGLPSSWVYADHAVQLTYQAGRCTSTATVPLRFKLAASAALSALWRQLSASWARTPDFGTVDDETFNGPLDIENLIRSSVPAPDVKHQSVW